MNDYKKRFIYSSLLLATIFSLSTLGYWIIGGGKYSILDCLYMTIVTLSTVGYKEVVEIDSAGFKIFTMFVILSGIGTLFYLVSNITAFVVEGELKRIFRRRTMEKRISKMRDHYIVCGLGMVGQNIVKELYLTKREQALVDIDDKKIDELKEIFPDLNMIVGDATDNEILIKAGVERAKGIFATVANDNENLVISIIAKQLNPNIRIVARCQDLKNAQKLKKAGVDSVVSPPYIGALRMASEMVRPEVVSFLDMMLRDRERNLRIEEIKIDKDSIYLGKKISELPLKKWGNPLLLAVKKEEKWIYNPPENLSITPGSTLIFMMDPKERIKLEEEFSKQVTKIGVRS